jgi:hypothetical protein
VQGRGIHRFGRGVRLHAGGVVFAYAVFDRGTLDLIFDLAIRQSTFEGDELTFLESLGELREIPPGVVLRVAKVVISKHPQPPVLPRKVAKGMACHPGLP